MQLNRICSEIKIKVHLMINLNYFSHLLQNLQQFKCNAYGTMWCSIKGVTKIPELVTL